MTEVRSRTTQRVLGARVFVNGEADLEAAASAQRGFRAMPLSAYLSEGLSHGPDE